MKLVTLILIVAVSWPGTIYAQAPQTAPSPLDAEIAALPIVTEAVALPRPPRSAGLRPEGSSRS